MMLWLEDLKENFFKERDRWIAWVPVLFGTGIGLYFMLPMEPSPMIIAVVVEILLILAYLSRFRPERLLLLHILLIISLGFADIQFQTLYKAKRVELTTQDEVTYLCGRIVKIDKSYSGKARLLLSDVADFDKSRRGYYRITTSSKHTDLQEGQCVETAASLMPNFLPVLPKTYQFGRKAFYEQMSASGYALSQIYKIDCADKPSISEGISYVLRKLRKNIVQRVNKHLEADEAAITATILAGDRTGISQKTAENYRNSGLAHFLSISGLHMSMVAGMAFFAFRFLLALVVPYSRRYDARKPAALWAVFISFIYLLISGAEIPTQRAFIMTFVVLLGVLFDRRAISLRMVSLAALIVLIVSPHALISAGFQMSFAAVVVLISFYERYASAIHHWFVGRNLLTIVAAYIVGLLVSDLVASLATLPFAIYHFNQIAVYTTPGNLLAGPIIGLVIMPFVLLALVLMPFGLEHFALYIVGIGVHWVNLITAWVAALPGAGFKITALPFWGLLSLVIGGLWLCLWQTKWRRLGLIGLCLGVLSLWTVQKPDVIYDSNGEMIALKDNLGDIVIMPQNVNNWVKQVWLEKTVSPDLNAGQKALLKNIYRGDEVDPAWIDLKCDENTCVYKDIFRWEKDGRIYLSDKEINPVEDGGGVIYLRKNSAKVQTVCDDVGARLWNSCGKLR